MIKNKEETSVTIGEGDEAKEVALYVTRPNNAVIRGADMHRTKIWNECVDKGIKTKQEILLMMKDRGVWSEAKDKEEEKITNEINRLEKVLYHGDGSGKKPKLSEGRKLAIDIRKERIKLRALIQERIALEENCAENLADNARFDYIVANCTFYANGNRVYKDLNDYNSRNADEIAFAAASKLGSMMYNLDTKFEENLPENKFLKQFGLVDEDLALIDPNEGYRIDTEGRRIDDEGFYLDDNGDRVDREGNPLDQDGTYQLTEYENDLVKPKRKTTKKTTTKTTESTES